jgi:hypothetical protein
MSPRFAYRVPVNLYDLPGRYCEKGVIEADDFDAVEQICLEVGPDVLDASSAPHLACPEDNVFVGAEPRDEYPICAREDEEVTVLCEREEDLEGD